MSLPPHVRWGGYDWKPDPVAKEALTSSLIVIG
jgi:coproporphyrinogen III oxidase